MGGRDRATCARTWWRAVVTSTFGSKPLTEETAMAAKAMSTTATYGTVPSQPTAAAKVQYRMKRSENRSYVVEVRAATPRDKY